LCGAAGFGRVWVFFFFFFGGFVNTVFFFFFLFSSGVNVEPPLQVACVREN